MGYFLVEGDDASAYGHPDECQEPAAGSVSLLLSSSVTINGQSVLTSETGALFFDDHAHDYDSENGCHNNESHSLTPTDTGSVTLNGDTIYDGDDTAADPITREKIEIDSTQNDSVRIVGLAE